MSEETFAKLLSSATARVRDREGTISLIATAALDPARNDYRQALNDIRSTKRTAQRELVAASSDLIVGHASSFAHGCGISQNQLSGIRRSFAEGPHGQLPRSNLGVSIRPAFPSAAQVQRADRLAIEDGDVLAMETIHEDGLVWARSSLEDGKITSLLLFFANLTRSCHVLAGQSRGSD